jgi:hypothetical protein
MTSCARVATRAFRKLEVGAVQLGDGRKVVEKMGALEWLAEAD